MSPLSFRHSRYSARSIALGAFSITIALLLIAYAAFQARFLIEGPIVSIENAPTSVSTERTVQIEGSAANIARMTLNGRPIYTNHKGRFTETLVLENGLSVATIRAEDRYGRTTTIERRFVFSAGIPDAVARGSEPAEAAHY